MLDLLPGQLLDIGGTLVQYPFVHIGKGNAFHLRVSQESLQIGEAHAITANQPNADLVIRTYGICTRLDKEGTHGQSRSQQGGLLDKCSTCGHGYVVF